jgi:hypothetical protein
MIKFGIITKCWVMFPNWKHVVQHGIHELVAIQWKIIYSFCLIIVLEHLLIYGQQGWTWHICSCDKFHEFTMGAFSCDNLNFWSFWYDRRTTLVDQVWDLLVPYNLLDKLIAYLKDGGGNISTFAWAIKFCGGLCSFNTCSSLTRDVIWDAFNKTCKHVLQPLMFMVTFKRLVWRPCNLPYKKLLPLIRNLLFLASQFVNKCN